MVEETNTYLRKCYLLFTLDPVHVGTGQAKLGRVDNPIVREPSTNLPKLPATSIAGVIRSYTTLHYSSQLLKDGGRSAENCAEDVKLRPCKKTTCPVCVTFGFPKDEETDGFSSMAEFLDAQLLFFPVHSMFGPVWVTSPNALRALVDAEVLDDSHLDVKIESGSNDIQSNIKANKINLGWLLLNIKIKSSPLTKAGEETLMKLGCTKLILDRLVMVSEKLFSQAVNSNVETRTSTAIDVVTGSSKEGALFNYEAIPRSTVLWFTAIYKDPRNFQMAGAKLECDVNWVREQTEKGLAYLEYLGIGGRTTRGMGKLRPFIVD